MTLPGQKPAEGKVTTTITMPTPMADEVKAEAARAGIGWTQMMQVLIRQSLDARKAQANG